MKKWISVLLCIVLLCPVLLSCRTKRSPIETLEAFAAAYPLPAGRFYDSEADEGRERYLPPVLFDAFFTRAPGDDDREDIQRFALFLGTSSSRVAEMGIFECPDRDAAAEIIGCLRARIDLCRAAGKTDTSAAADPTIALYGRTVVYTVLPDNEKAARVLSRLF